MCNNGQPYQVTQSLLLLFFFQICESDQSSDAIVDYFRHIFRITKSKTYFTCQVASQLCSFATYNAHCWDELSLITTDLKILFHWLNCSFKDWCKYYMLHMLGNWMLPKCCCSSGFISFCSAMLNDSIIMTVAVLTAFMINNCSVYGIPIKCI